MDFRVIDLLRYPTVGSVGLFLEAAGFLIAAVMAVTAFSLKKYEFSPAGKYFRYLTYVLFIYTVVELIWYACTGVEELWVLYYVTTYISNALAGFLTLFIFLYVNAIIEEKTSIAKAFKIILFTACVIRISVFIIPKLQQKIIIVTEDVNFAYGPWTVYYILGCLVAIITFIALVIVYWHCFRPKYAVLFIVNIVLTAICDSILIFYGICDLLAVICYLCVYISIYQDRARDYAMQQKELAESKEKLALQEVALTNARVSVMLSQIQPHFLFNTLSSIAMLCRKDPDKAGSTTIALSRYLQGNMESINYPSLIPFEKELEHTKLYLKIEQVRFGKKLNVEYDIDIFNFGIPPLTLQPLVENAVKHGVCAKAEGGTVVISSKDRGDHIEIMVRDDGKGFDTAVLTEVPVATDEDDLAYWERTKHIGITNVRDRLKTQCRGELTIESAVNKGTTVIINLPKEEL